MKLSVDVAHLHMAAIAAPSSLPFSTLRMAGQTHANQDTLALDVDVGNGKLVGERHFG